MPPDDNLWAAVLLTLTEVVNLVKCNVNPCMMYHDRFFVSFVRLCFCVSPAFGGRIQQPLIVVLVATHADLADIPRAFSGEFTYDKEKVLLKEVRNRSGQ